MTTLKPWLPTLLIACLVGSALFTFSCQDDIDEDSQAANDNKISLRALSANPHDSVGIMHNYYAEYIMDNTEIYKHDSLPYAFDSLENFVFQEFGYVIDLSGFTDQNSELISVSHHNNDDFTTTENTFLDNVIDSIESFDWSQTSPISEWNDMFEDIASDALDNNFDNEEDVLSTVSVAKHSGNLWYDTEVAVAASNGQSGPSWDIDIECFIEAVNGDMEFIGETPPTTGEDVIAVAIFSISVYDGCL